jgi:CheY-like chemotaxis protein
MSKVVERERAARESGPGFTKARAGDRRVLIVDDDEISAAVVSDFLGARGFEVHVAHRGDLALAAVGAVAPAVVLMDLKMPGLDGFEAIRAIRADPRPGVAKVPIITLTALAMPGDRERSLAAGADQYLAKPVRLLELEAAVAARADTAEVVPRAAAARNEP